MNNDYVEGSVRPVLGRAARGAVLVETALVLIYLLGLLFVGFQIGTLTYYQLLLDNAAQIQARVVGLGEQPAATTSILKQSLGHLSNIALNPPQQLAAPAYDLTIALTDFSAASARTGGFTFTSAIPIESVMSSNAGSLYLGNTSIHVNSEAFDATVKEICPHFCLDPEGPNDASAASNLIDYYSQGDNTTPYFVGFHDMFTCGDSSVGDLTNPGQPWDQCPTSLVLRAMGSAEHLDNQNNFYSRNTMSLDSGYSGLPGTAPSASQAGPFTEVWCHRNFYIWIDANALSAYPTIPAPSQTSAFLARWLGNDPVTGLPLPGKLMYQGTAANAGQTVGGPALGGWDVSGPSKANADYSEKPINSLSPWWGCGLYMGGTP